MNFKELSTEQLADLMQEDDWDCNSDMYSSGEDTQPDFHDKNEFPRSSLLEYHDVKDSDEVPSELIKRLES